MTILLIGIGILGAVLGLFYLKDRLKTRTLARIAYSGLVMRSTVIGTATGPSHEMLFTNRGLRRQL